MKKTAVITDAVSPEFFFPLWHRYYAGLFGAEALHVVTYQGLKQAFAGIALGNLWAVNAAYDDTLRAGVIADLIAVLLRSHDVVIRCDVDEFLHPDPRHFADLADFIQRNELPYVTAQGIDVIELAEDAPLDLDRPVFGVQRRYGLRSTALNKTCVTSVPLRWAEGFHGATVPPRFAGLYNLHLKFADLKKRIAWDQTMLRGLEPGGKAHKYFSVGIDHLTGVQKFFASRPKGGAEAQDAFNARFMETVHHRADSGIHQGAFFTQDFLVPLSELGIAAQVFAPADTVRAYNGLVLRDPPATDGVLRTLEEPGTIPRLAPEFIAGLATNETGLQLSAQQQIHGSYLVQRHDVLLFGPNHLVSRAGHWSCEARAAKGQFLAFYQAPFYNPTYPGAKPALTPGPDGTVLDMTGLGEGDVTEIEEPVFLATPLEPAVWGRWISTVAAKVAQFREYGTGRKFLCHTVLPWQKSFLHVLGVPDAAILPHDPGRSYICHDVMTVEYSFADLSVTAWERGNFFQLAAVHRGREKHPRKIFVSRLTRSRAHPRYRVLQNEAELAEALERLGFTTIEPEHHDIATQIAMFAAAEQIVFIGGSGIFNAAFCAPDASVLTLESAKRFTSSHVNFLSSLGLRHAVIFGQQDETDTAPDHKRWTLDIARALPLIEAFFSETGQ
jgi:hypothetical protein